MRTQVIAFSIILISILNTVPSISQNIFELVKNGDLSSVKELISENAEAVNYRDDDRKTPLHWAAIKGELKIAEFLLENGAAIEDFNWNMNTAVHFASMYGNNDVLEMLISRGAEFTQKNSLNITPVFYGAKYGNKAIVEILLKNGVPVKSKSVNGITLLHSAAVGGNSMLIDFLLDKELDPNAKNKYGITPLHFAASKKRIDAAESLIRKGADLNIKSLDGRTPLNIAQANDHTEMAESLLEKGADNSPHILPALTGRYMGFDPPGKQPDIFAPGIISTDGFEFALTFSPDGSEMYFTRREGLMNLQSNTIMVTKMVNGSWTEPIPAPFSGRIFDFEPHVSPDGERMFFGSIRPLEEGGQITGMHEWVLERSEGSWGVPKPITAPLIDVSVMYLTQALSKNVYYTGMNDQGQPGIYISEWKNGKYREPVRLDENVNYNPYSAHPFIAPDESFIIFDAQPENPKNYKSYMYITYRNPDGTWTRAVDMGDTINMGHDLMCPSVSPDGKYLFFSMEGNIYWVDAGIIEDLKPDDIK